MRSRRLKDLAQMRAIAASGQITAKVLQTVGRLSRSGVRLQELNSLAKEQILARKGQPNFEGLYGFPGAICASVNSCVLHSPPSDYVLKPADLVSIDCGVNLSGWHSDSAITVLVGGGGDPELAARRYKLSEATRMALWAGIAALARARFIEEVSAAIQDSIAGSGGQYSLLKDYVGHGIGRSLHEPPDVPNTRRKKPGAKVEAGLVIAIEPMVVDGSNAVTIAKDKWSVVTQDGSDGAHWEHTVAVHDRGVWVCTALDGGRSGLEPFGMAPVSLD